MQLKRKQRIIILLLLSLIINLFEGYSSIFAASTNANMSFWYASIKDSGAISEFGSTYDHGKILYGVIDGETAYCLNYAKSADNGQNMTSYSSSSTSLTSEQNKYLKYCMYYGFHSSSSGEPSDSQKNKYIATQAMVWIIEKNIFNTSSANSAAKKLCATAPDSTASYEYYICLKENMLTAIKVETPSFTASTKSGATTYICEWNEENSRYEITLTDSNKVLSNFSFSLSGFKTSRSGNKLTIYSKSAITSAAIATLTSNDGTVEVIGNCIFWRVTGSNSSSYQEFVSAVPESEPVTSYFKVKTESVGYGAIYKKDSSTGTVLSGAIYGIYSNKTCTTLVEKLTTNKNGYAKSGALATGIYYVKEITAPENYVLSTTVYTLTVKADEITSITVTDKGQKGSLTIYKKGQVLTGWDGTDFEYETGYLSGAVFTVKAGTAIYQADGTKIYVKGDVVAENLVTGEDGSVTVSNLPLGTYVVTESQAPDGYKINSVEKSVTISYANQTASISYASTSITNSRQKAKVKISKQDEETHSLLEGAEYGIYTKTSIKDNSGTVIVKKNTLLEKVMTDASGTATFNVDLPINYSYYVKEITAPEGYTLSDEKYEFSFSYLNQEKASIAFSYTFLNSRVTGRINLRKMDMESGENKSQGYGILEGAVYALYAREDIVHSDGNTGVLYRSGELIETMITDENGEASVSGLYLGYYYVKEIEAPNGYILNEEEIEVKLEYEGQKVSVVSENVECQDMPVTVIVKKRDSNSGEELSGAVLSLLDEEETIIETWTTEVGISHIIKGLEVGKTYMIRENSAPDGYLKAEDIVFIVEDTEEEQVIIMEDQTPTGTVCINKKGEFLNTINPVEANDGLLSYLFGYITGSLSGVTFELYAEEDIITVDGNRVIYEEGERVATLVTNENGIAQATELPLGNYYLVESGTVEGFVLDDEKISCSLTYQDQYTEVVYAGFELENERQKVAVSIVKTDADTGERLSGVVFGLYTSEEIRNADEEAITEKNVLLEKAVTNQDGVAQFTSDLPFGSYYIEEIQTLDGYATSKERFEFIAEYQGDDVEIMKFSAEFLNAPIKVAVSKTDSTGENELAGAVLTVLDSTGEIVESWTSTGKSHVIERLPVGSYTLREESAPYGYVVTQDILFEVTDTDEIQQVVMQDETAKGKIIIYKTDQRTGKPLEGVEFEVRNANDEVLETMVTGEEGYVESELYEIGTYKNGVFVDSLSYYVMETKALDGYVISDEIVEVMFEYVNDGMEVIEYVVEVSNAREVTEEELPKTGDSWKWWWIVGGGIIFIIIIKRNIISIF